MARWILSLMLASLLVAGARSAWAQACCTGATAHELSVVGTCNDAVAVSQLGYDHAFGSFDSGSRYRSLGATHADDVILTLGAGVRLWPKRLQLGGTLPARWQRRSLPGAGASSALGLGDAAVGLRYTILDDPIGGMNAESPNWMPSVDLVVGVKIPSGRPPDQSRDATAADVTGDGAWAGSLGVQVTKFLSHEHVVIARGAWSHRLPRDVDLGLGRQSLALGDEITAGAVYLFIPSIHWSYGAFLDARFTLDSKLDGQRLDDSGSRRLRAGLLLTHVWKFPSWESTLAVSADPFFSGPSYNLPFAGTSVALLLRRNFR